VPACCETATAAARSPWRFTDKPKTQMTLVKLHACQYPKVKWFPDIGQSWAL
jgi:hypothetical protein